MSSFIIWTSFFKFWRPYNVLNCWDKSNFVHFRNKKARNRCWSLDGAAHTLCNRFSMKFFLVWWVGWNSVRRWFVSYLVLGNQFEPIKTDLSCKFLNLNIFFLATGAWIWLLREGFSLLLPTFYFGCSRYFESLCFSFRAKSLLNLCEYWQVIEMELYWDNC